MKVLAKRLRKESNLDLVPADELLVRALPIGLRSRCVFDSMRIGIYDHETGLKQEQKGTTGLCKDSNLDPGPAGKRLVLVPCQLDHTACE